MTLIRRLTPEQFAENCYNQLAALSLECGFSVQEARDGAVIIDKLLVETGHRAPSNIINFADVRAGRGA